jgi:hypothetical protein
MKQINEEDKISHKTILNDFGENDNILRLNYSKFCTRDSSLKLMEDFIPNPEISCSSSIITDNNVGGSMANMKIEEEVEELQRLQKVEKNHLKK